MGSLTDGKARCFEIRCVMSDGSRDMMRSSSVRGLHEHNLFVALDELEDPATKWALYQELMGFIGFEWNLLPEGQRNCFLRFHHSFNPDLLECTKRIHESTRLLEDVSVSAATFEFI